MATPDEIQKLLKELEKVYKELGTKNPFANFDASKISDANSAISILNSGLRDAKRELDDINGDLNETVVGFKKTVEEIKNTNLGLNLATKTFNGLSDIARKLKSDQAGINELSGKELKNLQNQSKEKREDLKVSKDLLESRISELKTLERKGPLDTKSKNELIQSVNAAQAIKNELREQDTLSSLINGRLNQRIKQEERIEGLLGLGGNAIEGAKTALDKLGFGGLANALGLDKVKEEMDKVAKSIEKSEGYTGGFSDKMQVLKKGISEAGTQFTKSLTDPTVVTTFLITEMISALKGADKATGELAKSFGTSYSEASSLRNELNTVANLSGDVNINTAALQKSLIVINKEFGTAAMLNSELLKDFTQLTTVVGLTEEAASGLARITVATGTNLSDNTAEILGTTAAYNGANKLALNSKEIAEQVAKASAATTLTLGMQPGAIAKAVIESKALGASMAQVEQIASSLLNFESSIEDEMSAELLLNKNLNLEKARTAALNGDIATVASEIAKQTGSAADFAKMNVIQQEALAKAVGMNREDLARSLIEREALVRLGKEDSNIQEEYNALKAKGLSDDAIAKKLGDETLARQLKSQSVQERFNATIEKLREIFVSLAEPVMQIISPFMDLATTILPLINIALMPFTAGIKVIGEGISYIVNSVKALFNSLTGSNEQLSVMQGIVGGIAGLYLAIKGYALSTQLIEGVILGIKARQSLLNQKELFTTGASLTKTIGMAVFNVISSFSKIPFGVGVGLGIAAAAGIASMASKYTKGDDIISPGYGERTLFGPEGAIALNNKDTVIAGTNLGGKNNSSKNISSPLPSIDITPLIERMSAVEGVLMQIFNKETNIYLDSTKVGTGFAVSTVKIQ